MADADHITGEFLLGVSEAASKVRNLPTQARHRLFASLGSLSRRRTSAEDTAAPGESIEEVQIKLAAMLEPDGGMPGRTIEARIANSLAVLFLFLQQGSTRESGPFRLHIDRLLRFLGAERLRALGPGNAGIATRALQEALSARQWSKIDWALRVPASGDIDCKAFWRDLASYVEASEKAAAG